METTITNLPAFRHNGNPESDLRAWQAERTAVAAVSSSQHMDVQLVTAEGDKVTLSLDAKAAAMYGTFENAAADEESFSAAKGEFSAALYEREMTFTVEGDLSAEEKKDIRKALRTLDRMMHNFVNGDLKPMLAKAEKLQGLESIAGLEAHMSYERTVVVAQQTQVTAVSGPAAQPVSQSVQSLSPSDTPVMSLADKADAVGDVMAQEVATAQTPADRMLAFVEQLLDDYRRRMEEFDPLGGRMIDRVAGRLHEALAQFNGVGDGVRDIAA